MRLPAAASRYRILAGGPFGRDEVRCLYDPRWNARFDPAEEARITKAWRIRAEAAAAGGGQLYDAALFRLDGVDTAEPPARGVTLRLGDTTYREYVGTRGRSGAAADVTADPLGTSVLLRTADGYVVFTERSHRAEINGGRLFTFGGFFDPAADRDASGAPDVFACAKRELVEELGLEVEAAALACLGIVYDDVHPHPEACFSAVVPQTADEVRRLHPAADETSALLLVPERELEGFVEENEARICEGLLGGLDLYRRGGPR